MEYEESREGPAATSTASSGRKKEQELICNSVPLATTAGQVGKPHLSLPPRSSPATMADQGSREATFFFD
jgi:hypothetical protein